MESRGRWDPDGKTEEGDARKGGNYRDLESSISFNGAWEEEEGERVWHVKAEPEDHEWHQ